MFNLSYPSSEYRLIHSLKPYLNYKKNARYPIGIGDDAAIRVCGGKEKLIFTADAFVQDVHFNPSYMTFEETGYKAMAINLSDCAAMAASPDGALVQIVFPENIGGRKCSGLIREIYKGLFEACRKWDFPIVGGNCSKGPRWIIDITLIGREEKGGRILPRTGAKNGDSLWVTGFPGESGAGLLCLRKWGGGRKVPAGYMTLVRRHVHPVPRIEIGRELGKNRFVHAAIDISDGISKECRTLSFENRLGIILDNDPECVSCALRRLAEKLKQDWHEWFFHGGEDYELLFAASQAFDPEAIVRKHQVPITRIGFFSKSINGVYRRTENGSIVPLHRGGWDHLRI